MLQHVIKTHLNASQIYARLASIPGKVLLDDSSREHGHRYAILGVDPRVTLSLTGDRKLLRRRGGGLEVAADVFAAARSMLSEIRELSDPPIAESVFAGGIMGYLGYELNRHFEDVPTSNPPDSTLPDAILAGFDTWFEIDESRVGEIRLISLDATESWQNRIGQMVDLIADGPELEEYRPPASRRVAYSNLDKAEYLNSVGRIHDYIREGEAYQVNLTQRFLLALEESPIAAFERIRANHPAPFGALLEYGKSAILSHSPESFVRIDGSLVESRPIKGTIHRSSDPTEDERLKKTLLESKKDQAELAMIVDLIRNDMSRVCRPMSVNVTEHAVIKSAPTVHHLVSTVEGRLKDGMDFFDLLQASWPGGSITGVPKISAMHIINELENLRRGPYTGSVGYVGIDGRSEWSIAIRTMILENGYARVHGGGGIVIDSDPESEFEESVVKVAGILDALDADIVS
ncbi:MAG: para-aminobenzoate synthetase component 1 [Planctomycetota bacterium]|jgi:para-aminobenzoate synthetase component 1